MKRGDSRNKILKASQRLSSLIDVVGDVAARISRAHTLIQRLRFSQMLGLGHHRSSPEAAGGSKSLRIDRCTERLVRHLVSPCPHPGRRFSSLRYDALELFDDQKQLRGIGGSETMLIALL